MRSAIIGKKLGMTQIFDEKGMVVPITVVEAGPCAVVQKKTKENDGYEAVQLGFENVKVSRVNRVRAGHFKKGNVAPKRWLKEFKLDNCAEVKSGDIVKVDVFKVGDCVDVCGVSKGKGFAGTIKRHNGHMLKASHGTGPVRRQAGSMSGAADPSQIKKGKKMPGHMGAETVTVQNLTVVKVDAENNLLAIKGSVPGPNGSMVTVVDCVKKPKNGEKVNG